MAINRLGKLLIWMAIALGFGLIVAVICSKGLFSQEAAGWVQGIGTLAALGLAIWLQDRERRLASQSEQRRILSSLRGTVEVILPQVRDIVEHLMRPNEQDVFREFFIERGERSKASEFVVESLNAFSVGTMPDAALAQALARAQINAGVLHARVLEVEDLLRRNIYRGSRAEMVLLRMEELQEALAAAGT